MNARSERRRAQRRHPESTPPPAERRPSLLARMAPAGRLAGPLAIVLAGAAMLARTWRTWPDPIVDYGREIYLASRLAAGDTLYVDVAHFSGPLSPYLNALWLRVFGPGVMTLAIANMVLTAGFVAMLYALLVRMAGRLAAAVGGVVFVVTFACAEYAVIGNYNWVCPYSHELPHGVMLTTAALLCLARYHDTRRPAWIAGVGLAAGLLVLTKAEVLLAGGLAVTAGLGLTLVAERPGAGRTVRLALVFLGAAALPLAITFACFAPVMPVGRILEWPLGHWRAASRPEFRGSAYYRTGMGLTDAGTSLKKLATAVAGYALALGAGALVAFAARFAGRARAVLALVAFAGAAVAGYRLVGESWVTEAGRPLPIVAALAAAFAAAGFARVRHDAAAASAASLRVAWAVFSLVLLAKMILDARVFHYGFVLAAPATILLVVAAVEWLPTALGRRNADAGVARAVALGLVAAMLVADLRFMGRLLDRKTHELGTGRDAIRTDARGIAVGRLLAEIGTRVGPGETLLVFPEGVLVSYLAQRVNPTPYYLFDVTSRVLWGEDTMLRALEEHPPDWIALVDRGASPGTPGVREWIGAHYESVWQQGVPQFRPGAPLAVVLMKRTVPGGS